MKIIPKGWLDVSPMEEYVPGTRFLPFKAPLSEEICRGHLDREYWFTPQMLLNRVPELGMVIDLTQTNRYYDKRILERRGVMHKKIVCRGGGSLPSSRIIREFFDLVDRFRSRPQGNSRGNIIGVHCTHGLNRTGYLICKYMIERLYYSPAEALELFQNARGYAIERPLYIQNILNSYGNEKITP